MLVWECGCRNQGGTQRSARACIDPRWGAGMAVPEGPALHPGLLPHGEGRLAGTHICPWVWSSWAQGAPQEINSFQAGSSGEACSFRHEPKQVSPALVPSQAITVHLLIAAFGVPGWACLPAAVGRAVTQTHTHPRPLLAPPLPPVVSPLPLMLGGTGSRSWKLLFSPHLPPSPPSLSPRSGAAVTKVTSPSTHDLMLGAPETAGPEVRRERIHEDAW